MTTISTMHAREVCALSAYLWRIRLLLELFTFCWLHTLQITIKSGHLLLIAGHMIALEQTANHVIATVLALLVIALLFQFIRFLVFLVALASLLVQQDSFWSIQPARLVTVTAQNALRPVLIALHVLLIFIWILFIFFAYRLALLVISKIAWTSNVMPVLFLVWLVHLPVRLVFLALALHIFLLQAVYLIVQPALISPIRPQISATLVIQIA